MTPEADQGGQSEDVQSAEEGDAQGRIAEHLAERGGDDPDQVEDVPAGNAGADAGAGGAARVEPDSRSTIQDESIHNDEPGIGTRRSGD